jgi:uncharacterized protein YndB with AHSA1/START domain
MTAAELTRIEDQVVVRAPRARVWKALTTAAEFSKWFRVKTEDEFRPGARVHMTSIHAGHEGTKFYLDIEEMEPERKFSWRWTPGGQQAGAPGEEPTLVVFELEEVAGGTMVKVTESGFERLSLARRAKAFEGNRRGWGLQMQNIREYVENAA